MLDELRTRLRALLGRPSPVALYYWSPDDHRGRNNFGDFLSRVIVGHVLSELGISPSRLRFDDDGDHSRDRRLLAIGSILHHAREGDVVWGSGVNGKDLHQKFRPGHLDVRMVRGPLTRRYLERNGVPCPADYGEPALLLSRYHPRPVATASRDYVIVPNLNDYRFYEDHERAVDPTSDWESVVTEICRAEFVVSSSLHGLVVADSYGIPARHLLSLAEPIFKYRDYYEGTGRQDVRFAHTIEEALRLGGVAAPECDPSRMLSRFPSDVLDA